MMAYQYADIKKDLRGTAYKGRRAYAMRAGSAGAPQGTGEFTGLRARALEAGRRRTGNLLSSGSWT
jgi:hypothetical protein